MDGYPATTIPRGAWASLTTGAGRVPVVVVVFRARAFAFSVQSAAATTALRTTTWLVCASSTSGKDSAMLSEDDSVRRLPFSMSVRCFAVVHVCFLALCCFLSLPKLINVSLFQHSRTPHPRRSRFQRPHSALPAP